MRTLGFVGMVGVLLVSGLLMMGCSGSDPDAKTKKWVADRTEKFVRLYKVGYDQIEAFQQDDHPCTRGHKAEQAALFHAVLANMNRSFSGFKKELKEKANGLEKTDGNTKNLLSTIDRLCKPFASTDSLQKCGKVDKKTAKEAFYLQSPTEALGQVATYRRLLQEGS